ncbi:putative intracellular protease/amidase [Salsuginibacillus halophilus]|uniref:Putative intracellular protease/amidase n=1 Tax=Salsuginibacillus halophilus TaxID=517424 RepID=A0A2P8HYK1_9BACI|nr:type 1 glutamine amidotransferase domain-containing protein [Salsuginibacillus halophilus]PSL51300.1 putative intracellular protease/amidase [Salsuginibacillus halophilus]
MTKKVLMVLTNHTEITKGHETGLWLEEFVVPYNEFLAQGYEVKVTSISGGEVPLDPNSVEDRPEWKDAEAELTNTEKLSTAHTVGYDAVFLPGGHGTMFDFPENSTLLEVLQHFAENDKVIGAVCHGPAGLVRATYEDGTPIVKNKTITAFTDEEETEMQLDQHMPFMLETELQKQGANIDRGEKWSDHSVRDNRLVTGQNPQSSASTAKKVVEALS